MILLEGDLAALELRDAALGLVEAAAAAEAAAATTTTTATATTAATTEATTTTAVSGARGAEVQAQSAALNLIALHGAVGSLGLLDGAVLNVAEALGATRLGVGRQTDTDNAAGLTEAVTESVLGGTEGQVADEQSVAGGAGGVTERAGPVLGTVTLLLVVLAASSVVKVDGAAIELRALLSGHSLDGIGSVGVLDVAETAGAARLTVGNDTAARELTELGELALEPVLIDVPGQVTDEQVGRGALGDLLGLGLLSRGGGLLIGLALLRGLGVLAVRVGVGGVGVRAVRVGRVL